MKPTQIEIQGLKELEKNLIKLQKEYGGKAGARAIRPAITAALKPLEQSILETTPVDEGTLKASVKRRVGVVTRDMRAFSPSKYKSTTVLAGRVGYWGKRVYKRAVSMEYGTVNVAARHTLRDAFDAEAKGMARVFGEKLGPAIEKTAKALHRKQTRG